MSEPDSKKYKKVCRNLPNLAILSKSATSGEFQVNVSHVNIRKKSLGKNFTVFSLNGSPELLKFASINNEHAFDMSGDKICLPITDVLLCADVGNLA